MKLNRRLRDAAQDLVACRGMVKQAENAFTVALDDYLIGKSSSEFAKVIGFSKQHVSDMKNGKRTPSLDALHAILEADKRTK